MIVPISYPPSGSGGLNGLGCGGNCGCDHCKSGMGDTGIAPLDALIGFMTQTLPLGPSGIPVWVLVAAGLIGASFLMPGPSDYRAAAGRRRRV